MAVGGARGTAGGDSDGLVRYWRVPRGRCSLGSARTSKLVISFRRVIVRWVLWRAFPLRSISRFGATPHGVPAGIGSGLARELHPLGLTNRLGYYGLVTLGDWGTVYQRLSGDTIKLPFGGWRCGSGLGIYTEPADLCMYMHRPYTIIYIYTYICTYACTASGLGLACEH